jgi:exodeoxyribonuclease VII large subunit
MIMLGLDEAKVGIIQGTRKLLDTTKSYLLGYATSLSSKVQNRLTHEKSRIAVSRNLIATVPITMVKRQHERLADRIERLKSGYKRQLANQQKDLALLKHRFRPDRFLRRITQEMACVCDWRNRFMQMFKSALNFKRQGLSHLSDRFKLESIISTLANERTKLSNKAATLRAADPVTSLERGFSLVYTDNGALVKNVSQVQVADKLKTEVSDGRIISTVNKTERK